MVGTNAWIVMTWWGFRQDAGSAASVMPRVPPANGYDINRVGWLMTSPSRDTSLMSLGDVGEMGLEPQL